MKKAKQKSPVNSRGFLIGQLLLSAKTSPEIETHAYRESDYADGEENSIDIRHGKLSFNNNYDAENDKYSGDYVKYGVSVHDYLASLTPTKNKMAEDSAPLANANKLTLPENPGIKNPTTKAAKRILPKSITSLETVSDWLGAIQPHSSKLRHFVNRNGF